MNIYENEDVVPNVASLGRQGFNQGSNANEPKDGS
jgi:hypothetical protein